MKISYKRLWKLLIDRNLKKKDLIKLADISGYTLARMNKGKNVSTETLAKICKVLNCGFDDIMEIQDLGEFDEVWIPQANCKLNKIAISQMKVLNETESSKLLKWEKIDDSNSIKQREILWA